MLISIIILVRLQLFFALFLGISQRLQFSPHLVPKSYDHSSDFTNINLFTFMTCSYPPKLLFYLKTLAHVRGTPGKCPPGSPHSLLFMQFSRLNLKIKTLLGVCIPPGPKSWIRQYQIRQFQIVNSYLLVQSLT